MSLKSLFYRIYEKLLKHFDSKDEKRLREYYQKRYGVTIGKYTYGYNIEDIARGTTIGNFCSIARDAKIGFMNHPLTFVSTNPFLYYKNRGFIEEDKKLDVKCGSKIDNDVWIGTNAIILPGVHIGNGAVIGAGAVVTKDVLPYEIVGGVPAKHLKYRFEDEEVRKKLEKIDWYHWSDEKIKENINLFYAPNDFVEKFGKDL